MVRLDHTIFWPALCPLWMTEAVTKLTASMVLAVMKTKAWSAGWWFEELTCSGVGTNSFWTSAWHLQNRAQDTGINNYIHNLQRYIHWHSYELIHRAAKKSTGNLQLHEGYLWTIALAWDNNLSLYPTKANHAYSKARKDIKAIPFWSWLNYSLAKAFSHWI